MKQPTKTSDKESLMSDGRGGASKFPHRLREEERIEVIKKYFGTCSHLELSLKCGVTLRTFYRDQAKWIKSGGFNDYLMEEWCTLYRDDDISKAMKFQALTNMLKWNQKDVSSVEDGSQRVQIIIKENSVPVQESNLIE